MTHIYIKKCSHIYKLKSFLQKVKKVTKYAFIGQQKNKKPCINNNEQLWVITMKTKYGSLHRSLWGLGATMLRTSQMCKPYVLSQIKTKKKQCNMKGISNFVKTAIAVQIRRRTSKRGHIKRRMPLRLFFFNFLLISSMNRWEPKTEGSWDFLPHSLVYMMHVNV